MRKLFFSFLLLAATHAAAQNKKAVIDTARSFVPTGFRVGMDLITPGKSFSNPSYKGWEVNLDTDFWKYNLAVDYGFESRNISFSGNNVGKYNNTGHYLRVGVDVNFLMKDPDRNRLFVGIRYGYGRLGESVVFSDSVKNFGQKQYALQYTLQNSHIRARWLELVAGISLKVWKGLWMGYTGRLKFGSKISGNPSFSTFDVPGYGLKMPTLSWGFNYQVFWRFAWKKTGPLRPVKDK